MFLRFDQGITTTGIRIELLMYVRLLLVYIFDNYVRKEKSGIKLLFLIYDSELRKV